MDLSLDEVIRVNKKKSLKRRHTEKDNRSSKFHEKSSRKYEEPTQTKAIYDGKDIHGINSIIDEMMSDEDDNLTMQPYSKIRKVTQSKIVKRAHRESFEKESEILRQPQKRRSILKTTPITRVVVKNLALSVDQEDMEELFQDFKSVLKVVLDKDCNGHSLGSAYALFSSRTEALRAVSTYNEVPLDDKPMHIAIKKSKNTGVNSKPKTPSRKSVFSRISRNPSSSSALQTRDTNKHRHRSLPRNDLDYDLSQKKHIKLNNRQELRSEYFDFDNPDSKEYSIGYFNEYHSKKENRDRHDRWSNKQSRREYRPTRLTIQDLDAELDEIVNPPIDTDVFGH